MSKHIAIIGAGPAGVSAAAAAAGAGANVTLIGAEPAGGRANWHSLLPSKVLLTAADQLGASRRFAELGLGSASAVGPQIEQMTRRIQQLSRTESARQTADLTAKGVTFVTGTASFVDEHTLRIEPPEGEPTTVEAAAIIIAGGSVPIFPPNLRPNGKEIIAPRFIGKLPALPRSLIMVGGGVTGTEFVYAFNRFGVEVTWLVDPKGVLPTFNREVTDHLVAILERRGVTVYQGSPAESAAVEDGQVTVTLQDGQRFRAEMAFIAIGRRPDADGLNLAAVGLQAKGRAGIAVDEYGRSAVSHIYAAGDVTGAPLTGNKAMAQGWIAGLHAAGNSPEPYRPETIIEAVYSDPQVAQVGLLERRAEQAGHTVRVLKSGYEAVLKPNLLGEVEGLVKLVVDATDDTLLGAAAVGDHAADVLAPLAMALQQGVKLDAVAALFPAYPSLSELASVGARG